ncbi:MAG TPA: protein kinase, partial [Acidimicrobiales bacterium]
MGAVTGDETVGEAAGGDVVGGDAVRDGSTDRAAGDRWYCGPAADRRSYVVDDIGAVVEGGQGHVVQAERRTFAGDPVGYAGPVSLKMMTERRPERVAVVRDRWLRLAAIDHPNLVRALEVFEGPGLFRTICPPVTDDVLYVAASWVEGRSLRAVAPVDPPAAAAVARDLAAALAALHDHGLVHRDVHPGNVVIGDDGRATLIDLGSARPDDGGATATVAGALGFIPPETLHGPGGAAADRWGLGMVTVFALLGHPQGAAGRAALEAELAGVLAGTGDRRRLVGLLAAMVDPDPSRRPADPVGWARELSDALQARPARRARRRVALAGGAAALTLAAAGTGVLGGDRGEAPPAGSAATSASSEASASDAPASSVAPAPAAAPACTPVAAGGASSDMAAAVDRLVPGACAEGVPHAFVDAEVQPVADADGESL